jgi:hypothetical protein
MRAARLLLNLTGVSVFVRLLHAKKARSRGWCDGASIDCACFSRDQLWLET